MFGVGNAVERDAAGHRGTQAVQGDAGVGVVLPARGFDAQDAREVRRQLADVALEALHVQQLHRNHVDLGEVFALHQPRGDLLIPDQLKDLTLVSAAPNLTVELLGDGLEDPFFTYGVGADDNDGLRVGSVL